jgi:anti-sigma factor RsiW
MMKGRIDETEEFLLSRLLDGDLPAAEADVLRRRIEREPELGEAFDALAGVDRLLARRRDDEPRVDWGRFHARVMQAVTETAAPPRMVIPLSRYLWFGGPLAAAAAIALLFTIQARDLPSPAGPSGPVPIRVVLSVPRESAGGSIDVQYRRLAPAAPAESTTLQVAFVRSEQMDNLVRDQDQAQRDRPPSLVVKAMHRASSPTPTPGSMDPFGAITGS